MSIACVELLAATAVYFVSIEIRAKVARVKSFRSRIRQNFRKKLDLGLNQECNFSRLSKSGVENTTTVNSTALVKKCKT